MNRYADSAQVGLTHRHVIVELATAGRLPLIAGARDFADLGGLMSFGPDPAEQARVGAGYVARVLQGENPADMPIQRMDKLELIINQKTARALGLAIPPTLLARADEVIE